MSERTYIGNRKLVWLRGEIKTPPFSAEARREAGFLLRRLQHGASLAMPKSRPMPVIGAGCHELRIADESGQWRIIYRIESDELVVIEIFMKKTRRTPPWIIDACRARLRRYDHGRS